jgi:hypothetical protein
VRYTIHGKVVRDHGYAFILCSWHPRASKNGRVQEHIVIMERQLGRFLLPGENVHHRNGIRHDNRPENLELWVVSQPYGQRVEDVIAHARWILERYGVAA